MMPTFITIALALLTLVGSRTSKPVSTHPLELRVNQIMSMSAPALIRLTTRVEPNVDNRQVCVFVANNEGTYESSSCRDTDGAPLTIEWSWWMPRGHYKAVATLDTIEKLGAIKTVVTFQIGGDEE